MGKSYGSIPNPYTPLTARRLKEQLGEAISKRIAASGTTAADISRRYKSIRSGDIARIRAGDAELYGLPRLIAIAEALGLEMRVTVS